MIIRSAHFRQLPVQGMKVYRDAWTDARFAILCLDRHTGRQYQQKVTYHEKVLGLGEYRLFTDDTNPEDILTRSPVLYFSGQRRGAEVKPNKESFYRIMIIIDNNNKANK